MAPGPTAPDKSPAQAEQLVGTVLRITFQNEENGYSVIKLQPEGRIDSRRLLPKGEVAAVGSMPGIAVGQMIRAEGEWIVDSKFGPQFKVKWFKPTLPTGCRGIEVYLSSGAIKGVGPVTAARIVQTFGEKTFDVIENEPARLKEVPKLGVKAVSKIIEGWRTAKGDRELVTFLGDHGVAPGIAARLSKTYQESALSIIKSNPYRLATDIRGIGFMRADVIARKMGLPLEAPERIDAALSHVLERQAEEGHTYLPRPRLENLAEELLGIDRALITARLDDALEHDRVTMEMLEGESAIFANVLHQAERRVADAIALLSRSPKALPRIDAVSALADFEQRTQFQLAAAQREAALMLAREGMLILTGGPGTGKTTAVRSIIELFDMGRLRVKLAAPTGRAARRLSETGKLPAETIHRLLGFQAHNGTFQRDAANPIDADLLIVDEASMLDAPLAANLFEAVGGRCCLMLVGDEDQLPSVGPGNVLGDLIASGVIPKVRLTEIFRQAGESMIVSNAHRINQGLMPYLDPVQGNAEPDFFFIEREEPAQVIDVIKTMVAERIPRKFQLNPHSDIQVLTPMRRGELGVEALNEAMKQLLNPGPSGGQGGGQLALDGSAAESPRRGLQFNPGDRIMQTSNNYDKQVFNGDIGRVESTNPETRELMVDYDGRPVSYLRDEVDQLTLAYAITIHKSQGSEYPAVIIPIHTTHWIMLQRNLIYTAITRARRLVCLVGTRKALRRAVGNATRARRFTALRDFLESGKTDEP